MWAIEFNINGVLHFPKRDFTFVTNEKEREFFNRSEIPYLITVFMEKYPEIDNMEAGQVV